MLSLPESFAGALLALLRRRWLLVGVGNSMRGDDGFGPLLARRLASLGLPAIDAGSAPENFTGPILGAAPDQLIVADAADLGEQVGAVRLLDPGQAVTSGASTHDPGLGLLLKHLCARRAMEATILATQPGPRGLGCTISDEVRTVVDALVRLFDCAETGYQRPPNEATARNAGSRSIRGPRRRWHQLGGRATPPPDRSRGSTGPV